DWVPSTHTRQLQRLFGLSYYLESTALFSNCVLRLARVSRTCATSAGTVFRMIRMSSHSDLFLTYSMSRWIIWLKVVLFLPLTCQRPVRPGTVSNRSLCQGR